MIILFLSDCLYNNVFLHWIVLQHVKYCEVLCICLNMINVKIKERLRCSGLKKKEAELSAKTYEMSREKASGGV